MKEAVILDFDGTLTSAYDALAAELGYGAQPAPAPGREVALDSAADSSARIYSVMRDMYERGIKLVVTSDRPVALVQKLMEQIVVDPYLCGVYGADSVGERKPHPAIVQRAMVDLAVRQDLALFAGDMLVDVEMAHAAGLQCAIVIGAATRTQCVKEAPDHVLYDWSQLPELVKSI